MSNLQDKGQESLDSYIDVASRDLSVVGTVSVVKSERFVLSGFNLRAMAMCFGRKTVYMPEIQKNTFYMPFSHAKEALLSTWGSMLMAWARRFAHPWSCGTTHANRFSLHRPADGRWGGDNEPALELWTCASQSTQVVFWFLSNLDNLGRESSKSTHIIISGDSDQW